MDQLTSKQLIAAMVTFQARTGADLDEILKFVKEITTITTNFGISLMKEKINEIATAGSYNDQTGNDEAGK